LVRGIDVFGSPMAVVVGAVASALILIGWSMMYTLRLPRSEVGTKMRVAVLFTAAMFVALIGVVGLIYARNARHQLLHTDVLLPRQRWVTIADPGLVVRGNVSEACIPFSAQYQVKDGPPSISQLVRRSDGGVLALSARFLSQRGDTLGTGLSYGFSGRDGGVDICFERRNDLKGSRYSTLELMASDTMTITAVNWWSGYRIGAP
jgi:hypothetical protein